MATTKQFETWIKLVKSGDQAGVAAALEENPILAESRDENGVSVTLLALYYGQVETARLIASCKSSLDVFEAAALGETQRLQELLADDLTLVRETAPDGFSALGFACFFGHLPAARLLLASGADPNRPADNPTHVTPLHSAAASTAPAAAAPLCELLLSYGAQVNATQQGDFTALHAAAQNGDLALIALLLDHGADRSLRSSAGLTPFEYAQNAGHAAAAAMLRDSV